MKRLRIKKVLYFMIISIFLVALILGVTGCSAPYAKEHAYLFEQMSAIDIEIEGYELVKTDTGEGIQRKTGEYNVNGKDIKIDLKDITIDINFDYIITIDDKELMIDDSFMRERSETYVKISNIWVDKEEITKPLVFTEARVSTVGAVYCFDNRIFILTCGLDVHLLANVKGEIPYTLYCYDIGSDLVSYVGFYSGEKTEHNRYSGFIGPPISLKINKL